MKFNILSLCVIAGYLACSSFTTSPIQTQCQKTAANTKLLNSSSQDSHLLAKGKSSPKKNKKNKARQKSNSQPEYEYYLDTEPLQPNEVLTDLNAYLEQRGFFLSPPHSTKNEGYSSDLQRQAFSQDLKNLPQVKTIAEIGFNGGHSCETFMKTSDQIEVTSFDINMHPYVRVGVEFMRKKYPNRFEFIPGDSAITVKRYAERTSKKFDLIFIDGCHQFDHAVNDIYNCRKLAHQNTVVWIDDYAPYGVQGAVDHCVQQGLIKIIEAKNVMDTSGARAWAIVQYVHSSEAEAHFSEVYKNGLWGKDENGEGYSGPGSLVSEATPFLQYLQNFLDTHNIQSVVDIGCGDWVLAREINWGDREYLGIDVVGSVLRKNKAKYGSEKIKFIKLDAGSESLPQADLLICKDVLIHLPNSNIFHILAESKKFKYCIFVDDINTSENTANVNIPTYGFHQVNLMLSPFNVNPVKMDRYTSCGTTKQIILMRN